jgi:hypothetical protein
MDLDATDSKQIRGEITVMRSLDHPFIVCLFDVIHDDSRLCLVTELGECTLLRLLHDQQRIPERDACRYFYELMLALRYLHEDRHVSHRDIKAENVLLDANGHIRLADFGFARTYSAESPLMQTACGSPAYASPEVIKCGGYTASADLWSAGVLLFLLLTGEMPFAGGSAAKLFAAICDREPSFPPALSPAALDLMRGILQKDPAARFGIADIMTHPWLAQFAQRSLAGLARMRVVTGNTLDCAVMGAMHTLNLATGDLIGALARGEIDRATAVYKMLRRERHAAELEQWCEMGATEGRRSPRVSLGENSSLARTYENHARPTLPPSLTIMTKRANETGMRMRAGVIVPRIRRLGLTRPGSLMRTYAVRQGSFTEPM